ncbi:glycosyltransferase family 2 protein [Campylobacter volucris]|uniref:Glycosyltransferase family 2 protein n=1 Tax=Campylobacter volucris TaxID=1031542 RepID=A0AAE5YIR8_9BACT|nr:glycosyltransferase family 2 protein [Campylobacter volucris]AJC94519.1 glycosyltransferase, family 2 [Campylobacter volucris LMG 24379]KAB0578169.1 glycosyltransferase family 2 protein [Campylobacter volucris]QBL13129.1 glycosyltransferase family 2 protein [Campylobacter volucris]QEL08736.1 glycosyltransferase, family 2 [Campylobacter volucris]TXK71388.1 glycosyltransferase family 2 protein [Campylobacter volucris]
MSQISIILPTYNVEKYIARALDSCINQTFKNIEIIVVDDCGSDKSIDIAKEYASKDERIKIIHNKENLKLLRARYEGVKVANSPYIMFLDPDDYLELNACEECVKILHENSDIDLICFNYRKIYKNMKFDDVYYSKCFYSLKNFYAFLFLKYPYIQWSIWGKVLKKEIYLKTIKYLDLNNDEKINIAEDVLVYLFYLMQTTKIKTINNILINYFIRDTSLANGNNSEQLLYIIQGHKDIILKLENLNKSIFFDSKINKKLYNYFIYILKKEMYQYYFNYLKTTKQYKIHHSILKKILKFKYYFWRKF